LDTTASLNAAMRFIEQHLFDEIDFAEPAKIAGCTEYQFRRMFSFLAEMPLGEYIRRRRLTRAAELLRAGDEKIIDIALQCGYESPDAFAKAFQAVFGVSPSSYRKNPATLKAFPPLFFHLTLKGGISMDYRIVERGEFYLMGKTGHIPMIYHGPNPHTADVWKKLSQADLLVLTEYSRVDPKGVVCAYSSSENVIPAAEGEVVPMVVGVVMEEPMPARFKGRFDVVPYEASTWLVFSAMDNTKDSSLASFPHIYAQISEWLPISEYEHTSSLALTWHESYDISKPDRKSEIWVPVRRR